MNQEDVIREEKIRKKLEEIRADFAPTEENLKFIYSALSDESWRVRKDAVSVALAHPVDKVTDLLIKGLFSEDNAGLRNACQEALTKIGDPVVDKLISAFGTADSDVRKFVLDIIGDIGNSKYTEFLISALKDEDENVVISACENLGKIKNQIAIEPLLKMIDPKNEWLSFVILESLSQIGKPFDAKQILPLWQISQLRKPILDILYMFDEESQKELLKRSFQEKSFYIQQNASRAVFRLFNNNSQILPKLQDYLGDTITFNENYLTLLKGVREDELVYALISFISRDPQFFVNLIEKATDETLEFFGSLSSYGRFKNYKIILELINNYEGRIQAYLAYLIGLFKIDEGVEVLKNLCRSEYGHTRQAVAFSLGRLIHGFDIACLFELLDDKYRDVREEAIKSLSKIISKESFPLDLAFNIFESRNKEKIISLLSLMKRIGYFNEKLLIMALRDINPSVRARAIKIISEFKLKEYINEVFLLLTDEEEEVRYEAILCLGNIIDNPEEGEFLASFLEDENNNIKKAAIRSIFNISPGLFKRLEDKIFSNLNPLIYLLLLDLLKEGAPVSKEKLIDAAKKIDDYDIYRELLRAFIDTGDYETSKRLITELEREKGAVSLKEEFDFYFGEKD